MKKKVVAIAIAALMSSVAFAGNNSNNNGPVYTTTGTTVSNAIKNDNRNPVPNRNKDAQHQSQNQTQSQTNAPTISPTTVSQGGTSSVNTPESNNASQSVSIHNPRQVASAANVTIMPTAVCSGSTAAGAQGASFGLSFGTSWTDNNCMLLEQVRTTVVILDQPDVAKEMMCAIDAYREARIRLGKPCKQGPAAKAAKEAEGQRIMKADEYTDPIVRHRLGLPPLN